MGTAKKADKDFGFNFSPQVGVATGLLSGLSDWIKNKKAAEVAAMQQQGMLQRALAPVMYQEQARTRRFETEQRGLLDRWMKEQDIGQERWQAEHDVRMKNLDIQLQGLEDTLTLGREQMTSEENVANMREQMANLRTQIQEFSDLQQTSMEQFGANVRANISEFGALERTRMTQTGETMRAGTWQQKTTEYIRQDKEALNRLKFEKTFTMSQEDAKLMASLERAADVYLGIALQRADEPDNIELQTQYSQALDEYENLRKQAHAKGLPVSTISPPKFTPGRQRRLWFDVKPTITPRLELKTRQQEEQPRGKQPAVKDTRQEQLDVYIQRFKSRGRDALNDDEVRSLKNKGWSENDINALRESIKVGEKEVSKVGAQARKKVVAGAKPKDWHEVLNWFLSSRKYELIDYHIKQLRERGWTEAQMRELQRELKTRK